MVSRTSMGTSATLVLTWISFWRVVSAGDHSGIMIRPNFSPLSKRNTSAFTAVTFMETERASLGGRMMASTTPEILGCEAGVSGGAQGEGNVTFISERWIDDRESVEFMSRWGRGIGMVRPERILGSHFGRGEVWWEPEMKTFVVLEGSIRAWKRISRGDRAVSEHGSNRLCGRDDIALDTLTVIFFPG